MGWTSAANCGWGGSRNSSWQHVIPVGGNFPFITDTGLYAPPTSGAYEYSPPGTFIPENSGFPGLAGTYVDPVFGTTIKRITQQTHGLTTYSGGDIYVKQGFWSANGTYFVHTFDDVASSTTVKAVRVSDGATFTLSNISSASRQNASCHPVNDNEYYYFSGSTLVRQLISTGATNVVHTFSSALGPLGASLDIFDNTGQYMIVNLGTGGAVRFTVYDLVNDIVFTGGGTWDPAGGWATISPDGNNIIVVGATHRYKYAIDKSAHTVASTDTQFMTLQAGSDHGCISLASDGKVYFTSINNDNIPAFLQRTDIATGTTTTFFTFPSDAYFCAQPDQMSSPKRGDYKDWVFCSTDTTIMQSTQKTADLAGSSDPWTTWGKMQNEIYMVNVLTGELRRLAHHRSRQNTTSDLYGYLPRVCAYWGGTSQYVAWASNQGFISSPLGCIDIYTLTVPTTGTGGATARSAVVSQNLGGLTQSATATSGGVTTTTFDPSNNKSNGVLSNGNLTLTAGSTTPGRTRTVSSVSGSKYWEILPSIGAGVHNYQAIIPSTYSITSATSITLTTGCFYADTAASYFNGSTYLSDYSNGVLVSGDWIGFAINTSISRLWIRRCLANGTAPRGWLGDTTGTIHNPVGNIGGINISSITGGTIYVIVEAGETGNTITLNSGASAFKVAAPSGYGNI